VPQPHSPDADRRWMLEAIELSRRCPPSASAFSVGAVVVAADGSVLGHGYSRERDPADHAEEVALARAAALAGQGWDLAAALRAATLYSSLEPCAARASRPVPCADLIIDSGIGRVVIAWREPPIFVPGGGATQLRKAGVAVAVVPELAAAAKAVNAHLLADLGPQARPRRQDPAGPATGGTSDGGAVRLRADGGRSGTPRAGAADCRLAPADARRSGAQSSRCGA
jgi:diaminohydroxyphosphoribosylaminopyrimidine deaminase / 5-amino-6-(5-phosphoribosylamino)uracil reductase